MFKFVVTTESHTPDVVDHNAAAAANPAYGQAQQPLDQARTPPPATQDTNNNPSNNDPPEVSASSIDTGAQFADLHNRLQALMKHITFLNRDIGQSRSELQNRFDAMASTMSHLEASLQPLSSLAAIERKLDAIQADVRQTKADLHNALDKHVAGLRNEVRDGHQDVLGSITGSKTGIGGFLLVVFGSQGLLVLAYVWYKRRKANGPKKYL